MLPLLVWIGNFDTSLISIVRVGEERQGPHPYMADYHIFLCWEQKMLRWEQKMLPFVCAFTMVGLVLSVF